MAVNFKTNYLLAYSELMAEAIKTGTPYQESISYLEEQFSNLNITDREKATLTAQYIANVTSTVTTQAMQLAFTLTDKEIKSDNEYEMQVVQKDIAVATKQDRIDLAKWQTLTAEENYNYAKEKAIALPQSVDFNNKVKALDSVSDLYGNHKLGGGTITSSMWSLPFGIIDQLVNGTTGTVTTTGLTTSE